MFMKIPSSVSIKTASIIGVLLLLVGGISGYVVSTLTSSLDSNSNSFEIIGNGTTDVGVMLTFSAKFNSIPAGIPSYMWFVNGNYSTSNVLSYSFSSPGKYKIELRISFNNNKTYGIATAKEIVNPALSAQASASKTQILSGQTVYLNSTVVNGTAPYKFSWSLFFYPGSGDYISDVFGNASAQNTTLIINGTGMYYITYKVTDSAMVTKSIELSLRVSS